MFHEKGKVCARAVTIAAVGAVLGAHPVAAASGAGDWDYSDERGPAHWSSLHDDYRGCDGRNQSPVDIRDTLEAELPALALDHQPGTAELVDNAHTVQVGWSDGGGLELDGIEFELLQMHFHAPSEHQVDGRSFPLEAHLVHQSEAGELAVLGALVVEGESLAAIVPVLRELASPSTPPARGPLEPGGFLPSELDYFRYSGSLTTPPCSEGVRWLVLRQPIEMSAEQIGALTARMGDNARPVQPLHARRVLR